MLAATACGHAVSRPVQPIPRARLATATTADGGPRVATTRKTKLLYEISGRSFPLPIVTGTVAGHRALMLVDTGANSHVLSAWLARKLALPMRKLGDVGTDHVGKTIATYRVDEPKLAIDGWGTLSEGPALATEIPEVIEKLGIGAFISPQKLAEEGDAVVLDLPRGELRAVWWVDAIEELSSRGKPLVLGKDFRACQENEGPIRGLAFVVPAHVDGQAVRLLVDTGAQYSDVFTSSSAGKRLLPTSVKNREAMYTASGKISGRKIYRARVLTGEVEVTTDVDLIQGTADASCPRDGVLAMDVLGACAILLGRQKIFASCGDGAELQERTNR